MGEDGRDVKFRSRRCHPDRRYEKKAGPRMVIASTFPIRVVPVVCQALVAERVPAPSAFVPDSASDRSTSGPMVYVFLEERVAQN